MKSMYVYNLYPQEGLKLQIECKIDWFNIKD